MAPKTKPQRFYKVQKMRPAGIASWTAANGKSIREPVTDIGKTPPIPKPRKPRN